MAKTFERALLSFRLSATAPDYGRFELFDAAALSAGVPAVANSSSMSAGATAWDATAGAGLTNGLARMDAWRRGGDRTNSMTVKTAAHLGQRIGVRPRSKKGVLQLRHRRFSPSSALVIDVVPFKAMQSTQSFRLNRSLSPPPRTNPRGAGLHALLGAKNSVDLQEAAI